MTARATRFALFDSLRAIGALGVLLFHAAFQARVGLGDSVLRPYVARLDVGVTVFFLVSGFLLYRPYVRARLRGEPGPRVGAYAWRRLLRIAPAYWVALTAVVLALGLPGVFSLAGVPRFYGFAQIYSAGTGLGGIGQAWTLCVEVSFYAFLPLWAWLMRLLPGTGDPRRGVRVELAALALLAVSSAAYKVLAVRHISPNSLAAGPWLMPLPNFLDDFALGMALAALSAWLGERSGPPPRALRLIDRFPSLPWLGAAVAFWAVSTRIGFTGRLFQGATPRMFLERHALYALVALGLVVPAAFGEETRGLVRRVLANRALLWVGLISYGVYLYHFAVLMLLERAWGVAPVWLPEGVGWRLGLYAVAGVAGACVLGGLSYQLVERPALGLKRFVAPEVGVSADEALAEPAPPAVRGPG